MRHLLLNLMRCRRGATILEYAALAALVVAAAVLLLDPLGRSMTAGIASTTQQIDRARLDAMRGRPAGPRGVSVRWDARGDGKISGIERHYPPAAGTRK